MENLNGNFNKYSSWNWEAKLRLDHFWDRPSDVVSWGFEATFAKF